MPLYVKWPKIPHWPTSPGRTQRAVADPNRFLHIDIVITEKLDGSNTMINNGLVYNRDVQTPSIHKSNALVQKYHAWKTNYFSNSIYIFGENIYPIHSIEYDPMHPEETYRAFGMMQANYGQAKLLSFPEFEYLANELCIPIVPVLDRNRYSTLETLEETIQQLMDEPSSLGGEREGLVIRSAHVLYRPEMLTHMAKVVRKDRVKTDAEHWRTGVWKPCKLLTSKSQDT